MASYIDKVNFYNEGGGLQKSVPIKDSDTAASVASLTTKVSTNTTKIASMRYSVTDFGVPNDGSRDVSDDINALLAKYHYLFFPAGTYKFSNPISYTGNCSITGAGKNVSKLIFSVGGISIDLTGDEYYGDNICIRDISIISNGSTSAAIRIDGSDVLNDRVSIRPLIKNIDVGLLSEPGSGQGFYTAVTLINCNGSVIDSCSFYGGENGENGVLLVSRANAISPTEFMITNCKISHFTSSIRLNTDNTTTHNIEGLIVTSCVLLAADTNIKWNSGTLTDHLFVNNSHLSAHDANINISNIAQFVINDNLCYVDSTGNCNILVGNGCYGGNICGNIMEILGTSSIYHVVVNGRNVNITSNYFGIGNCINFKSSSNHCVENNNNYEGGYNVSDNGQENFISEGVINVTLTTGVTGQGVMNCFRNQKGIYLQGAVMCSSAKNNGDLILSFDTKCSTKPLVNIMVPSSNGTEQALVNYANGKVTSATSIKAATILIFNLFIPYTFVA